MSDSFIADMEEISGEITEHQIKTFGRELTQEEHERVYEELFEESKRKYEGMTVEETAKAQIENLKNWEKEMVERYGIQFFEGFHYLNDDEEEYDGGYNEKRSAVNV
jgi:hypothetical protein